MTAKSPYDHLSQEARAKLRLLGEGIRYGKITVSHTLEARTASGDRRVVTVTLSAVPPGDPFQRESLRMVRLLLGRQAVASAYDEARHRGFSLDNEAAEVLGRYDAAIAAEVSK